MSRRPLLSTWGEAVVAAATGDSVMMAELLSGKHDDGVGIDLRTFRSSWDDVDFLLSARNIRIEPHFTLIEIAVERDHFDVVMLLTAPPPNETSVSGNPPDDPPQLHRAVSSVVAPPLPGQCNLPDELRELAASCTTLERDGPLAGLPRLRLPNRQTFFLARAAVELPLEARQAACGLLLEDQYTQEDVDAAIKWWAAVLGGALGAAEQELVLPPWGLHALYTSGDGNCLLHACLLATLGIRDTRVPPAGEPGASTAAELRHHAPRRTLRAAVHHCITHCGPLRALLAHHGCELGCELGRELEPRAAGLAAETLESRSIRHGNSCDPGHVLALAHIFGRPIICYAAASVGEVREADEGRTMSNYAAAGARMSGIYLPSLLPPHECFSRDPILLAYTRGHFSALVSTELAAEPDVWRAIGIRPVARSCPIPLVDETLADLPLLFPPADHRPGSDSDRRLLEAYLDVRPSAPLALPSGPPEQRRSILVTSQQVPPLHEGDDATMDELYYASVWQRRVASAMAMDRPLARQDSAASCRSTCSWEVVTHEEAGTGTSGGVAMHPVVVEAQPLGPDDGTLLHAGQVVVEGRAV